VPFPKNFHVPIPVKATPRLLVMFFALPSLFLSACGNNNTTLKVTCPARHGQLQTKNSRVLPAGSQWTYRALRVVPEPSAKRLRSLHPPPESVYRRMARSHHFGLRRRLQFLDYREATNLRTPMANG